MKKILFINASVRPHSRTLILAKEVLDRLEGSVEEVNLEQAGILPLTWERLQVRDAHAAEKDFSHPIFQYARQFAAADEIVLAAPYWDLSFPATVRTYIEAVCVVGLTFHYTADNVSEGLCRAKKLHYVTTAGGSIGQNNLGYDYIKTIAQTFFSIPEFRFYSAENLDLPGMNPEEILQKAIAEISVG
ncbi:MAG: NAD(P)H-dependent oxidoreductase [Angelakisella sp.]